jgi:diguanylate cyclase (GGDEF)-like protein
VLGSIRQIDIAARYGGEEFSVILPGTHLEAALHVAERIRKSVEQAKIIRDAQELGVTTSLGVAQFNPKTDKDNRSFIERADRALYNSKQNGRNRVSFL